VDIVYFVAKAFDFAIVEVVDIVPPVAAICHAIFEPRRVGQDLSCVPSSPVLARIRK